MPSPGVPAPMRWASAQSRLEDPVAAAEEVARALESALGEPAQAPPPAAAAPGQSKPAAPGARASAPDLVLAFFTAPLVPGAEALAATLKCRLAPGCLAAVSA